MESDTTWDQRKQSDQQHRPDLNRDSERPYRSPGLDQLQHLGPQPTGATFAIQRLKNHLGGSGNVSSLGAQARTLLQLGGLGKKDLTIRALRGAARGWRLRTNQPAGARADGMGG
jgi:hypothetical protein